MALKAQYTAYHDTIRSADGSYPNENTCAAPPEIPFGTKIKVSGTGTYVDGRVYTVTDRGRLVKKQETVTYLICGCHLKASAAHLGGVMGGQR